jgi:6,7-dimethyl-8-ribityllumazine synthase
MNQSAPASLPRIAIIQSCWHKDIVDRGRDAFLARLEQIGLRHTIDRFDVPGAFEIPLHAKILGASGRYAALIACGFVVDGGIYRHEFVAQAVISGLMQVQLDTGVPIFSVVLTPQHFHEHETHREFFLQHMNRKGVEAADACMHALQSLAQVRAAATAGPAVACA